MLKTALSLLMVLFAFNHAAWAIPAEGSQLMIAAPSPYAVEVGKEIAKRGGNVVDVAVAVGLTLSVTSPYYAALGGGGFALVKVGDKDVDVLDFRETAPRSTSPQFYLNKAKDASQNGGAAVGVPGFPAGLWALHQKYGKLSWRDLFKQPIHLANRGFQVSGEWVKRTNDAKERFNKGGLKHLTQDGKSLLPGETLKQKPLASVLERFRQRKVKGFYEGRVAEDIVNTVQKTGGVLTLEDMKNYKVRWLKPLEQDFAGYKVYLMPPPSSGGVVIKSALQMMEKVGLAKMEAFSVKELHHLAEILNRSFRGRALLGDPDFHKNPLDLLLSQKYIDEMVSSISASKAKQLKPLAENKTSESSETTHYSVMDIHGNAVSLTVTLNGNYGSAVVSDKYGVALNNEMDDFTTRPGEPNMFGLVQGNGNVVQPGKRPLSSMSPTLATKNGKVVLSLGAPGGPRIISGTLQALYRVLVTGMDMDAAIQAPRLHHQYLPNKLFVDPWRFQPATLEGLKKKGHVVDENWIARVVGVRINQAGHLEAAFDSRGEGAAGGF